MSSQEQSSCSLPWVSTRKALPPLYPDPLNWEQSSVLVLVRVHGQPCLARYVIPLWDDKPDPGNPPHWVLDGAEALHIKPIDVEAWCPIPP